jgi:hypothetical protein
MTDSTRCVRRATRSVWPKLFHGARCCSSQPWASRHKSGPRTQNTHPILLSKLATSWLERGRKVLYQSPLVREPRQSCPVEHQSIRSTGSKPLQQQTNLGPSLEYNWLVTRSFRVGKCAYGLCALVFKASEKFMELLHAERLQEPLAVINRVRFWGLALNDNRWIERWRTHMDPGVHQRHQSKGMCLRPRRDRRPE